MNEKKTGKDVLKSIIREGVEKELENHDVLSVSDEDMIRSGQSLPPEEIFEKVVEKIKKHEK